ncbi:hypothetical protein [Streptomyces sp. NPDC059442]|uniref:hypothetical protein n=1 Tax=unclassified Streptomyces TaxID=2593676 RepID=UPI00369AF8F8
MIDPADIELSEFLTRWHGAPLSSEQPLPAEASWLPAPLREWHALALQWKKLRSGANRMSEPSRIQVDLGRAVFMTDATGDWIWAFDSENPDLVYEGSPGATLERVPERLPEFLVHLTVTETITVSESSRIGDQVPNEELPGILSPMQEVGFGEWQWPRSGYRTYMSDSLIASVGPAVDPISPWLNRDGYSSVRIAGVTPSALGYLDAVSTVEWIEVEFDDEW